MISEHKLDLEEQALAVAPGSAGLSCLVLHGLGGGPYELLPLIEALEAAGVRVSAPVLPGHEGPGPVMPASRWEDWANEAEAAFDVLAAERGPVAVVGFSTGGTLALRLATRRRVSRLALLAPFLAIRYSGLIPIRPASYLQSLAALVPDLPRRPPACRDPEQRKWAAAASPFKTFNLHATLSALQLIDVVKVDVPRIDVPALILQGSLDTVVEPSDSAWLHRHLGTGMEAKSLRFFARSDHLLALDRDREQVVAAVLEFVTRRDQSNG